MAKWSDKRLATMPTEAARAARLNSFFEHQGWRDKAKASGWMSYDGHSPTPMLDDTWSTTLKEEMKYVTLTDAQLASLEDEDLPSPYAKDPSGRDHHSVLRDKAIEETLRLCEALEDLKDSNDEHMADLRHALTFWFSQVKYIQKDKIKKLRRPKHKHNEVTELEDDSTSSPQTRRHHHSMSARLSSSLTVHQDGTQASVQPVDKQNPAHSMSQAQIQSEIHVNPQAPHNSSAPIAPVIDLTRGKTADVVRLELSIWSTAQGISNDAQELMVDVEGFSIDAVWQLSENMALEEAVITGTRDYPDLSHKDRIRLLCWYGFPNPKVVTDQAGLKDCLSRAVKMWEAGGMHKPGTGDHPVINVVLFHRTARTAVEAWAKQQDKGDLGRLRTMQ